MSRPTWMLSPLAQQDIAQARQQFEAEEPLTPDEWAALIWYWTDIPTVGLCRNSRGQIVGYNCHDAGRAADGQALPKRLWYYPPSRIADKRYAWYTASEGQMRDWIALLEEGADKRAAWNHLHGYYIVREGQDAGEPPRTMKTIREQLAAQKSFAVRPVGSAEKGAMTAEQRKALESELAGRARNPVEEFFEEPAGAAEGVR